MNSMDSAFESQKFLSQQSITNSQKSTQDLFTPNSGSQERGNEKMSMYEKWLSKRSLYNHTTPVDNKLGAWASCPSQASSLNQPKYNSYNKHPVLDNSQKGTEGRLSLHHTNKVKAYERDERDLLEQITFNLQENQNEIKGLANGMKESMENLKGSLWEEMQQTVSSFQDNMKKLQDDIQSSLQVKEQVFHEIKDLKTVIHKKDSEIMNLQARLQDIEKRRNDEIAQFAKTVSEELKLPQEIITKKLEQISDKTVQVMENLNACKENNEIQMKDSQNLMKNISTFIKDSEKRLMTVLKKIEPKSVTSLKIREDVEACFENWLAEIQPLIKNEGMELKDAVTKEQRKYLDTCLRKHLQTVADKFKDVSQMLRNQLDVQESLLQTASSWDFERLKMSVEECNTTVENGTLLLKEIDQRSKYWLNHIFDPNHLKASKSRRETGSFQSSNAKKDNPQTFQVDRFSIESGQKARSSHWNGDDQQMHHKARVNEQGISSAYCHNHPESTTLDISYQVHQNSSFSSPNEFSGQCSTGTQHMSCSLAQLPARMPVINDFIETRKIVVESKPRDSSISSFGQPKSCKINPSPVATVKPLVNMNQTINSNVWEENRPLSPHQNHQQNFKYDLRKRKMRDVPQCSKPEKKTKLFSNKISQNNSASSYAVRKGFHRKPDTMRSQNMKPGSEIQNYSDHDNQCFGVHSSKPTSQAQIGHDSFMNDIQQRKILDNSSYTFKDERRAPSYLIWNNSQQNVAAENYRETQDPSEEVKSGISSPCYSVHSIAVRTPFRHIATAFSARRAGKSYHHSTVGRDMIRNSPHPTLLSDM